VKRVALDFAAPRSRSIGWILLGLALFLAFDAANTYRELSSTLAELEAPRQGRTTVASARGQDERGTQEADRVAQALMLPWDSLFHTLEGSTGDKVALLALQPDARKREIAISGEAKDYDAVLAFVTRLEKRDTLRGVHLVRHEVREDDPQHPMYFSILANWEGRP